MDAPSSPPPLPASRTSFATVLAFLGLLAAAAGWYLPWIDRLDVDGVGPSRGDLNRLDEEAKKEGVPEAVTAVVKRMLDNEAVSGRDLSVLGDFWFEQERTKLAPKEHRGWTVGLAVLRWAPWALLGVAALLLLGRLRKPSFPVGALVLTFALLIGGFAGLIWLGSSEAAKESVAADPKVLGVGMYALVFGGGAAFLGGLFAVRTSTWWKIYLLTIVAVVATVLGIMAYVDPK